MIHLGICESKGKLTNKLSLLEDSLRLIFVSPDRVMAFEKQNLVGVGDLVQWYNVCLASVRLWVSSGERVGWVGEKEKPSIIHHCKFPGLEQRAEFRKHSNNSPLIKLN